MELKTIAQEVREILENKRKEFGITFFEDTHTYTMIDNDGKLRSDWPSVSKVMKLFYQEFPTDEAALKKAKGDVVIAESFKEEWAQAGLYSTNLGSRVHYLLEQKSLELFGMDKEVRQPSFECDVSQILKGDSMVTAGSNFLELMKQRNAELLDTEIVLGHPGLGYTGQGDTGWLIKNKSGNDVGFIITDYKTNKEKNFQENQFTKKMFYPFDNLPDNSLGHYFTQLPFYGKLLLEMLKGTKYENLKLLGCIVVHLKDNGTFEEYRVPKNVIDTVLQMDMGKYLTKIKK